MRHDLLSKGIIESDDIALINLEIEKALNFSKKCAFLVESVKAKAEVQVQRTTLSFVRGLRCRVRARYFIMHNSLSPVYLAVSLCYFEIYMYFHPADLGALLSS